MAATLSAQTTIAELMNHWPAVIPYFIRKRLPCVGCDMARFETLEDLARIYHLDLDCFLNEIAAALDPPGRVEEDSEV